MGTSECEKAKLVKEYEEKKLNFKYNFENQKNILLRRYDENKEELKKKYAVEKEAITK